MTENEDMELRQESSDSSLGTLSASFQFTGPLPPPGILEQYERIQPGTADRIIKMAEAEQRHRQTMQEKLIDCQVLDVKQARFERRLGQFFGFGIGVVSILAGSVTAVMGAPIAGGLIGSTGVIGLVSVFVTGRRSLPKDQNPPLLEGSSDEGLEEA